MGRSIHNLYPLFRNIYIDMTLNKYNNTMRIRLTAILIITIQIILHVIIVIILIKIIITGMFKSKVNREKKKDITVEKY